MEKDWRYILVILLSRVLFAFDYLALFFQVRNRRLSPAQLEAPGNIDFSLLGVTAKNKSGAPQSSTPISRSLHVPCASTANTTEACKYRICSLRELAPDASKRAPSAGALRLKVAGPRTSNLRFTLHKTSHTAGADISWLHRQLASSGCPVAGT